MPEVDNIYHNIVEIIYEGSLSLTSGVRAMPSLAMLVYSSSVE